jgi:hypothetical protein
MPVFAVRPEGGGEGEGEGGRERKRPRKREEAVTETGKEAVNLGILEPGTSGFSTWRVNHYATRGMTGVHACR